MSNVVGSLEVLITASSGGLVSGLKTAEGELGKFAAAVSSGQLGLKTFGAGSLALGAGLLTVAGIIGGTAIKAATDWQQQLVETGNNAGMTASQIQEMGRAVLDLSAKTGAAKDQLLTAYMYIHDMGYAGKEASDLLQEAAKEALATGSDVSSAASTLATVMHEFNIPLRDAAKTMDVLHTAAASARMTIQDMVTEFGPVGSIAAQIGVPLNEAAAAFAALTRNGYDASRAATQVQDILVHVMNPTKAAQKAIASLSKTTGVGLVGDFSQAGLQSKGLVGVLDDVQKATGGNTQELMTLIPALRGGLGAAALVGKAHKDLTAILGNENKSLGSTEQAYAMYANTTAAQTARMHQQLNNLQIAVGAALVPAVSQLLKVITPIVQGIADWASKHPKLVAAILGGMVAFGLILTVGGAIALLFSAGLPGAIALGVALLVGAMVTLATMIGSNWDKISGFFRQHSQLITGILRALGGFFLTGVLGPMGVMATGILGHLNDLKGAWDNFRGFLGGVVNGIVSNFQHLASEAQKAMSHLDPFAKHSPSLVDQVTAGVRLIKGQYASIGDIQLRTPQFALSGAVGNYNQTSSVQTSTVNMNNNFNITGQANAMNLVAALAFELEHKGVV